MIGLQDFLALWSAEQEFSGLRGIRSRLHSNITALKEWFARTSGRLIESTRPAHRWVFAATIVLMATIMIWVSISGNAPDIILRDQSRPDHINKIAILSPDQNQVLSAEARTFTWSGIEQAAYYNFILLGQEGDIIFEHKVHVSHIDLPESLVLEKKQPYFWQVEAYLINGATLRSEMIKFFY